MLILIAESKTMQDRQNAVSPEEWKSNTPPGEETASDIMDNLGNLTVGELSIETGLSASLASKLRRMIYDFPDKSCGLRAIEAYTGVVFKALGYDSLSPEAKERCNCEVRIISSLYGFLRPLDIIKPYRLDFGAKVAPGDTALNSFWRKDVTLELVNTLRRKGINEVLNLLPGDAAKCIDWKLVKKFCKVWKVDFVEIVEGDKTKTPIASKLKTMRGKLTRQIVSEGISNIAALRLVHSEEYFCTGTPVYPDHLQFLC